MELSLCIEMVLREIPFEQRFARAAELGFNNVEMFFVDRSFKGTPAQLARLASDAGVRVVNTVIGAPNGGLGGGLTDSRNRATWLDRTRLTLDFNQAAGIPNTIVCTGNLVDGLTDAQMEASVLDGLAETASLAEAAGVTLLLEPLNTRCDHAGYWLTSSDRAAQICRRIASPRLKLLFDCYHMQVMEGDLLAHIQRNLDVIGHFHAAGVPGRHELFFGELNYPFILDRIRSLGYPALFGLEYLPSLPSDESLRRTLAYLTP